MFTQKPQSTAAMAANWTTPTDAQQPKLPLMEGIALVWVSSCGWALT